MRTHSKGKTMRIIIILALMLSLFFSNLGLSSNQKLPSSIKTLRKSLEDQDTFVQRLSLNQLEKSLYFQKYNKSTLKEALSLLIQCLESEDNHIQQESLYTIAVVFMINRKYTETFRKAGGIPTLISLLKSSNKETSKLTEKVFRLFLYKNSGGKESIIHAHLIFPLVFSLKSSNPQTQIHAVNTLAYFMYDSPENQKAAYKAGAIPHFITLLDSQNFEVVKKSSYALEIFAYNNPENCHIIQEFKRARNK